MTREYGPAMVPRVDGPAKGFARLWIDQGRTEAGNTKLRDEENAMRSRAWGQLSVIFLASAALVGCEGGPFGQRATISPPPPGGRAQTNQTPPPNPFQQAGTQRPPQGAFPTAPTGPGGYPQGTSNDQMFRPSSSTAFPPPNYPNSSVPPGALPGSGPTVPPIGGAPSLPPNSGFGAGRPTTPFPPSPSAPGIPTPPDFNQFQR